MAGPMPSPAPGTPCPPFTATAAVSGRTIDNAALAGHKAVLVVHGPKSTQAPKEVAKAVRGKSMDPEDPVIVTVVDLRSMAGLWRKVAEATIKTTYANLSQRLPPGEDPAKHILICPDWDGTVCKAIGVDEPDRAPVAIVVGANGVIKAVVPAGATMGQGVLDALDGKS